MPQRPPVPSDLDLTGLSRKLVIVSATRIAVVTASFGAVFSLAERHDLGRAEASQLTLVIIAYAVSLLYALALRFKLASVLALAYGQVLVDSVLVTLLLMTTGGIESVFTFAYVFVVIGGAMTLYRRGTILATGASLLFLGTMALLQVDNSVPILPYVDSGRAALSMFTLVISLALVAGLSGTLAENLLATGQRLAEAQHQFERLEELQAAILRSLPAGLMTLDVDGRIGYANDAASAILGVPFDALRGQPIGDIVIGMDPPWRAIVASGDPANPKERFEAGYLRPGGGPARLGFSFAPLGTSAEASTGMIVVFQDVTEIVRLKEAFERADRLAVLGKLAAGLAHEVRNPLASMCASIDVLKDAISPPEPMKRLMDNVVREGDRLNRLITEFLTFARPREPTVRPTDLALLVQEFSDVFKYEAAGAKISVLVSISPPVTAPADPDMIRQVLWNLAQNAAQALSERGGRIEIGARSMDTFAEIWVRDDGPGIPQDALNRIFEPFFTTKDRGTGLGLAIAHSLIEAHGGNLLVTSVVGRGTEFLMRLPRTNQVSDTAPSNAA